MPPTPNTQQIDAHNNSLTFVNKSCMHDLSGNQEEKENLSLNISRSTVQIKNSTASQFTNNISERKNHNGSAIKRLS